MLCKFKTQINAFSNTKSNSPFIDRFKTPAFLPGVSISASFFPDYPKAYLYPFPLRPLTQPSFRPALSLCLAAAQTVATAGSCLGREGGQDDRWLRR